MAGRLKYKEADWDETAALAEELSAEYTIKLASTAVDLWHVSTAIILRVDTFWTFDEDQRKLAEATKEFRRAPDLIRN